MLSTSVLREHRFINYNETQLKKLLRVLSQALPSSCLDSAPQKQAVGPMICAEARLYSIYPYEMSKREAGVNTIYAC
jgi:hypothetical protein